MKILKMLLALCFFLVAGESLAMSSIGKTLTLTLDNQSNHSLTFDHVRGENEGNIFYVSPTTIGAHSTAVVTGVITEDNDLAGELYFKDDRNSNNMLLILDPRASHVEQGIFNLNNPRYSTKIVSTKFSKKRKGENVLWIAEAKIEISDRIH